MQLLVTVVALLPLAWVSANNMQLPVGKCKYPLPSLPGFNITTLEGELFKYIYTPTSMVYKAVDSITMQIKKVEGAKNVYTERIRARSILGTQSNLKFMVKDLGDGILKKISEDDDTSYIASVVAIKKDIGLLYVCSDEGEETGEDFRYVIARKRVDPHMVKHPDILFKAINEKYKFSGKFRRLPQRWAKKNY